MSKGPLCLIVMCFSTILKIIMAKFFNVIRKIYMFMKYSRNRNGLHRHQNLKPLACNSNSPTPRMGSFNSAPKILNEDHQDDYMIVPNFKNKQELLDFCTQEKAKTSPLLKRTFDRYFRSNIVKNHYNIKDDVIGKIKNSTNFRVMQWNVLSQTLGQHNDNFIKCPTDALTWDCRKYNIIEELVQYNPDIICLQEVDHFHFLEMFLSTQGYEGIFFPKPDSPCIYVEGNNGPDGCAIFYKKTRFTKIFSEAKILEVWKVQSNQVAIVIGLQCLNTGIEMCVATTHLKARNGALLSKLRNEQGIDLLNFVNSHASKNPVIVCGDFNAEPTEPVYRTILSNSRLDLGSAYANYLMGTQDNIESERSAAFEPPYTTWKIREEGEICHTIDYIFYSKNSLQVTGILNVPTRNDVGEGKVPSYNYPSDHFSLICDFEFSIKNS